MNGSLPGVESIGRRHTGEREAAVAWVESPLQLLCVIEARYAGLLGPVTHVVPRAGQRSLLSTRHALADLELPGGLHVAEPRSRPPFGIGRTGGTWALGDAFSGRVQRSVALNRPDRVVIVDDGLATIRLLELLAARRPLLRARAAAATGIHAWLRSVLGTVAGRRLRGRRLAVFTALPVPEPLARAVRGLGVELVRHDFAWLRSLPASAPPAERTVVLGTSLVRNGLIRREPYLSWLSRLGEPIAYYPHRREDPADLARIRDISGVEIVDSGLPAELTLRDLRPGQRVLSLPSTAITSLRVLLGSRGVAMEAVDVPDEWWTPAADPSLRSHLRLFAAADTARDVHR